MIPVRLNASKDLGLLISAAIGTLWRASMSIDAIDTKFIFSYKSIKKDQGDFRLTFKSVSVNSPSI